MVETNSSHEDTNVLISKAIMVENCKDVVRWVQYFHK